MERKEIAHLAIDLLEEALEKPNKTIVLEERITRPICEPGMKEPTEEELKQVRILTWELIYNISTTQLYREDVKSLPPKEEGIIYKNNSKILYTKSRR